VVTSADQRSGLPSSSTQVTPTAAVIVDGVSRKLSRLPGRSEYLVVDVPREHDAVLAVTDDERTQSLSLRTGKRGSDAVAAYYYPVPHDEGALANFARFQIGSASTLEYIELKLELNLRPYVDDRRWAPNGQVWLEMSLWCSVFPGDPDFTLTVDLPTSLTLRLPDGTPLPLPAGSNVPAHNAVEVTSPRSDTQFFSVTDSTRVLRTTFAVHGALTYQSRPATLRRTPAERFNRRTSATEVDALTFDFTG
jgi:hypothetical protein